MGSGKTTVGPLLAGRLGWSFHDVDDVIEAEAGATIAELFSRHGEELFREREHATIARLAAGNNLVLALGGGAIERAETRDLLLTAPGTLLVHLRWNWLPRFCVAGEPKTSGPSLPTRQISPIATRSGFRSTAWPTCRFRSMP